MSEFDGQLPPLRKTRHLGKTYKHRDADISVTISQGPDNYDYMAQWREPTHNTVAFYDEEYLDRLVQDGTLVDPYKNAVKPVVKKVYIIGSLRNPEVAAFANYLRDELPGIEVFDDWMAAGPEADDYWRDYEKAKGNSLEEALQGHAAQHVFQYDKGHLDSSDVVILMLPAGKSGHLELGYSIGKGKKSAILLDAQPDRYDVMYGFADKVTADKASLIQWLKEVL